MIKNRIIKKKVNILNYSFNVLNRAFNILALFFLLCNLSFSQLKELETNCLWIVRESMYNKTMISNAINYADSVGFDIVFIQVRGRGHSFYNSDIVPKHPKINDEFDPLEYAISISKDKDIEVHAWVNSYILWSSNYEPKNKNHIYHTKKNWTESNIHLKSDSKIKLTDLQSPQWEGVYLAPTHPEVNPYLLSVFTEIIDKYNVDGIHLDYIRIQDKIYGYNRDGMNLFNDIYNINPRDILRGPEVVSKLYGISSENVKTIISAWDQFRRDSITDLVQNTYDMIKISNKEIKLSAAVKPNLIEARNRWYQDWGTWLSRGIIDFVVPMNYFREISHFNNSVQIMKSNLAPEELNMIIMGISTYNQDAQSAVDKILLTKLHGFEGISIFSWDSHKNNLDWFIPINNVLN